MKAKNPIFLEAVNVDAQNQINFAALQTVVSDYDKFIEDHVFAGQQAIFDLQDQAVSLKEGFEKLESWIKAYYK